MTMTMFLIVGIATMLTALLGRFAQPLCLVFDLVDHPSDRKLHPLPTPLLGGMALIWIILPISIVSAIFLPVVGAAQTVILLAIACYAITLLGLADDRRSLAARDRILISFLVFTSLALVEPIFSVRVLEFADRTVRIGLITPVIGIAFTTLCCVGLINAVNMADGKNGLVMGLLLGWLALIATAVPALLQPTAAAAGGSLAVLLYYNLRGKVFLGDGGTYGFGCLIALLTIAAYTQSNPGTVHRLGADDIILIFIIPVIDSFRLSFVRWRRGQSPMAPDRDHFHHHLQAKFSWPNGLFAYWAVALMPMTIVMTTGLSAGVMIVLALALYTILLRAA